MTDVAIRVENLSKRYRIGGPQARYKTIRETVTDLAVAPVRRLRRLGQPAPPEETIWALKDVTLEVKRGEVVGIMGRNGAGKTTLLKILSRITEPTEGYAETQGRIGSLLEVGTGFHPELTGRENVYLNGAILGMKRTEIDTKFDEIVQFAEIERFLDTPVKRYSSGMYVRLAFAVAAHLEPEILLVDEVLAVGDSVFQRKCIGRMGDVARGGRTVLYVSHNMNSLRALCERAVWLSEGGVEQVGPAAEVISRYERASYADLAGDGHFDRRREEVRSKPFWINWLEIRNGKNELSTAFSYRDHLKLIADFAGIAPHDGWYVCFMIHGLNGQQITSFRSHLGQNVCFDRNTSRVQCGIGPLPLASGEYVVSIKVGLPNRTWDLWREAGVFRIVNCDPYASGHDHSSDEFGKVIVPHGWEIVGQVEKPVECSRP